MNARGILLGGVPPHVRVPPTRSDGGYPGYLPIGVPPPSGYPSLVGYPPSGYPLPSLMGGYLGYPHWVPPGHVQRGEPGAPPCWGTPWWGTPIGVPPLSGYPLARSDRGYPGYPPVRVPPNLDLAGVPPQPGPGWGTPPRCEQTDGWTDACQNITFPRTTYAIGN